jgi:hypothetical protein
VSAALPAGKTCRDCAHFKRCEMLFSANVARLAASTRCDWDPSRFIEPVRAAPRPADTMKSAVLAAYDRLGMKETP